MVGKINKTTEENNNNKSPANPAVTTRTLINICLKLLPHNQQSYFICNCHKSQYFDLKVSSVKTFQVKIEKSNCFCLGKGFLKMWNFEL